MRLKKDSKSLTILLPESLKDFRKLGVSDRQVLELAQRQYIIWQQAKLRSKPNKRISKNKKKRR